jgi:uncharacterized membrane protein YeaQ/YmgE (transglycosylase-associated protein family)
MSLLTFLLLGLVAGFIGSRIVGGDEGILGSLIVGVVGAMLGGFLFNLAGERGVTGFNLWSILVATAGASLLLLLFHGVRRRRLI